MVTCSDLQGVLFLVDLIGLESIPFVINKFVMDAWTTKHATEV